MTMLVNEYVDTIARQERREAAERRAAEAAAKRPSTPAGESTGTKVLTAVALIFLNVLLVAAMGVNLTTAPLFSWFVMIALVVTNTYTGFQLKEMFGTENSTQE